MSEYVAVYWLDVENNHSQYLKMLYNSIKSLRKYDKEIEVILVSPKALPFPYKSFNVKLIIQENIINYNKKNYKKYSKYSIFKINLAKYEKVIFLDVDTIIRENMTNIISRYKRFDFAARKYAKDLSELKYLLSKSSLKVKLNYNEINYNTGVFIFNPKFSEEIINNLRKEMNKKVKYSISLYNTKLKKEITQEVVEEVEEEYRLSNAIKSIKFKIGELSRNDNSMYCYERYKYANIFHFFYADYINVINKPMLKLKLYLFH